MYAPLKKKEFEGVFSQFPRVDASGHPGTVGYEISYRFYKTGRRFLQGYCDLVRLGPTSPESPFRALSHAVPTSDIRSRLRCFPTLTCVAQIQKSPVGHDFILIFRCSSFSHACMVCVRRQRALWQSMARHRRMAPLGTLVTIATTHSVTIAAV